MNVARMPPEVKSKIQQDSYNARDAAPLDPKTRGAITGRLTDAFGGAEARHLALAWLFDRLGVVLPNDPDTYITGLSSKSLTIGDWWALYLWIGSYKDAETGEWKARVEFPLEASLVLGEALRAYNALPIDRVKEDRSFVDALVTQAVAVGGEITNVQKPGGSWQATEGVALPMQVTEKPKEKRLFEPPPEVDF